MKKVVAVLFAALLCATLTLAQNNIATITDNGPDNVAYVEQVGPSNTATITQTGNFNFAGPGAYLVPAGWSVQGITQHGGGNTGSITQWNAGNIDRSIDKTAGIHAGMGQYGDYNAASIDQAANQQYAFVEQIGNHNTSSQYQRNFTISDVWQQGDWNSVNSYQTGYGQHNTAFQYGNHNTANLYQVGGNTYGNWANVVQNGDWNNSQQNQYTDHNTSNLTQTSAGQGNTFVGNQLGGDHNIVNLDQTDGTKAGSATVYQNGDDNLVEGLGADPLAISHGGSTLNVNQTGDTNVLHLSQANGSTANVLQNGNGNSGIVIQN